MNCVTHEDDTLVALAGSMIPWCRFGATVAAVEQSAMKPGVRQLERLAHPPSSAGPNESPGRAPVS